MLVCSTHTLDACLCACVPITIRADTKEMERRLEERLQAAAECRNEYARTNEARITGGGKRQLGMSGARGTDTTDRFSCKVCSWVGSSRTAHDREHPHCRAVPVSILSAGKVSPGFGTGGRFATYGLTSGDGAPGNKFLHETPKDKQSRLMNEAMRKHRGKAGGSPQAYTRTLGLS